MHFSALVKALIKQESNGNCFAKSPVGAKGLMQLMDPTGKEWHAILNIEEPYDPFDPLQNVTIGRAYLEWLLKQFKGDVKLSLAAYNGGIGRVKKLLKNGRTFDDIKEKLPKETREYVPKVLGHYHEFIKV